MKKRAMSLLLTLAMLVSLLSMVSVTASAADVENDVDLVLYTGIEYSIRREASLEGNYLVPAYQTNKGEIPPGMKLTGATDSWVISGTPTKAGTYQFHVFGSGQTDNEVTTYNCIVKDFNDTKTESYKLEMGKHFNALLPIQASSTTVVSCELVSGELPGGMKMMSGPSAVSISGTPDRYGTYQAVYAIKYENGQILKMTVNLTVFFDLNRTEESMTVPVNTSLGKKQLNIDTTDKVVSNVSLASGSLPDGVKLMRDTHSSISPIVLTGTPTKSGSYTAEIRVFFKDGISQLHTLAINVVDPVDGESAEALTVKAKETVGPTSMKIDLKGNSMTEAKVVSGALPDGMSWNRDKEALYIEGTPAAAGVYTVVFECICGDSGSVKHTLTLTVEEPQPEPITPEEPYTFPFKDVLESDWFYSWVKSAHQMGLIDGMSPDKFGPSGNMTYAQAITLAARMNQKFETGSVTLGNGTVNWYDTYVQYCMDKGIISQNYSSVINTNIDRQTYVDIFSKALPASQLKERNSIPDGSLPDVPESNPFSDSIYLFYRAGILNGSKPDGTFNPTSNIKRSEVAAILVRMMDDSYRVDAPADLKY